LTGIYCIDCSNIESKVSLLSRLDASKALKNAEKQLKNTEKRSEIAQKAGPF
jgi:hypothetical protein